MKGFVYFIQSGGPAGFIKIGTALNVEKRIALLQCGSPETLRLLKKLPGGHALERQLHKHFVHLHHRGEWFLPGNELMEFIGSDDCQPAPYSAVERRGRAMWTDYAERTHLEALRDPEAYIDDARERLGSRVAKRVFLEHIASLRKTAERHGLTIPDSIKSFWAEAR